MLAKKDLTSYQPIEPFKPDLEKTKNSFPPPLKTKCFKCQKPFLIKYVIPQKAYSKKNN